MAADYIGGDPSGVRRGDILWVVWQITLPFLLQKEDLEYALLEILDRLVDVLVDRGRFNFLEWLVSELLSTLAQVEVLDKDGNVLLDLGYPDYNLLPKPTRGKSE